ncbi:MAG: hypothetical protein U0Z70_18125 [Thermomicrobiales bacterium]|nr:hypothetical protein [Chloroflexia bacterium]
MDIPPASDRPVRPVVPPAPVVVDETIVARPMLPVRNRVQWGPVVAGVLAALVVFLLLTILGIALGASVLDPANTAGDIGTWAAVWGALTAIVAFVLGGWIAARAAVIEGTFAGLLNGLSVGIAGLLLIIWLTASGLGNLFGTIGSTVGSVLNVAAAVAPAAGDAANINPEQAGNQVEQATGIDVDNPEAAATAVVGQVEQATEQVETTLAQADNPQTFEAVRNGAFGTFLILLVPLIASAVGGWLGKYEREDLVQERIM